MNDCVFCKLASNGSTLKIWENEKYLAFLDMHPVQPGHALVIPKKHTDYIFDINDEEYCELMLNVKMVAVLLKSKMNSKKVGIIVEGFGVSHAHVHLIPINGLGELNTDKARMDADIEELRNLANKILNG